MLFAAVTGFGSVAQFTICNIIIQSESSSEMRGRAISILLMAIFGMLPLGSVVVGSVSQVIGAQTTLLCQGIVGIAVTFIFSWVLKKQRLKSAPAAQQIQTLTDSMKEAATP